MTMADNVVNLREGDKKPPPFVASFAAMFLHALEPIIRRSEEDDRLSVRGMHIEPCADGGALLMATDGVVLAVVKDPDGRASRAARVTIPDSLFQAAEPTPPTRLIDEGDEILVPAPEWMQAGEILLMENNGWVLPKMPIPGDEEGRMLLASVSAEVGNVYAGGYRVSAEERPLPWRRTFSSATPNPSSGLWLNPEALGRFRRLFNLFGRLRDDGSRDHALRLTFVQPNGPILVRLLGADNFVGAIMPIKPDLPVPEIPAWAAQS